MGINILVSYGDLPSKRGRSPRTCPECHLSFRPMLNTHGGYLVCPYCETRVTENGKRKGKEK